MTQENCCILIQISLNLFSRVQLTKTQLCSFVLDNNRQATSYYLNQLRAILHKYIYMQATWSQCIKSHKNVNIKVSHYWPGVHFSKDFFYLNSYPMKNTKFCTCHNSTAVMPCTNIHSNHFTITWMRAEWLFNGIWNTMEKSFVKCDNNLVLYIQSVFCMGFHYHDISWSHSNFHITKLCHKCLSFFLIESFVKKIQFTVDHKGTKCSIAIFI